MLNAPEVRPHRWNAKVSRHETPMCSLRHYARCCAFQNWNKLLQSQRVVRLYTEIRLRNVTCVRYQTQCRLTPYLVRLGAKKDEHRSIPEGSCTAPRTFTRGQFNERVGGDAAGSGLVGR
jgi:hypothetical protein